jgi:hypothetical protein
MEVAMALGGGDGSDGLLIGPFLEWWDKRTAKRDAKRVAKAEAKATKANKAAKGKSETSS